jgi:hypothetical protein
MMLLTNGSGMLPGIRFRLAGANEDIFRLAGAT